MGQDGIQSLVFPKLRTCKEWCVEMRGGRNEEHIVVPSALFFVHLHPLRFVLFFCVFLEKEKQLPITNMKRGRGGGRSESQFLGSLVQQLRSAEESAV
jgi:hypothetical protein